jgi:hypothetical protein
VPMVNPLKALHGAYDVVVNGEDYNSRMRDRVFNPKTSMAEDTQVFKALGNGFIEPMKKSWEQGKPVEAITQGALEVASWFVGAGEAKTASKLGEVGKIASEVTSVAGKTENIAEATRLAEKTAEAGKGAKGGEAVTKAETAALEAGKTRPKTATTTPNAKTPKTETGAPKGKKVETEAIAPKDKVPKVEEIEAGGTTHKKPVKPVNKTASQSGEGGTRRQVALEDVRYSQGDVSPKMSSPSGEKVSIETVAEDMKLHGFPKEAAPTVVEYPNGELVTLDHRRLVAANKAGITEVPATVFSANQRLPQRQIVAKRFRLKTSTPITDPRTGRIYHPGDVAETYGEAALIRSANQRTLRDEAGRLLHPEFPLEGSPEIPKIQTNREKVFNSKKGNLSVDQSKDSRKTETRSEAGNIEFELKKNQVHDIHPDNINPGRKEHPQRKHNCVNCSIATDSTLKGRPASALPSEKADLLVLENMYGAKAKRMKSQKEITSVMSELGDGRTGIVYVIYGEIPPFAHVFNVKNVAGKVHFYDGQTGAKASELFDNVVHMKLLNTN